MSELVYIFFFFPNKVAFQGQRTLNWWIFVYIQNSWSKEYMKILQQSVQNKSGFKPLFCADVIGFLLSLFCFSTTAHHHFLQSWLIPDGSCSSGRACWPCVAHQSWVFFFFMPHLISFQRVSEERFFFFPLREPARGCDASGPPCGWWTSFAETSAAQRLGDVARLKSHGYKWPSAAVPGPRLVGVSRLLEPWSSLLCFALPLSGRSPVSPTSRTRI